MKHPLLLLLLSLITIGKVRNSSQRLHFLTAEEPSLADAVSIAISRYAAIIWDHVKAPLYIDRYFMSNAAHCIQEDLLNRILDRLQYTLPVEISIFRPTVNSEKARFYNLVLIDNWVSFGMFLDNINDRYGTSGVFWIVFNVVKSDEIQGMLYQLWRSKVLFAFIFMIDPDANGAVRLYSYFPFADGLCGVIEPTMLDWEYDVLIGHRLQNFYGCPLRVGTINNPPFVSIVDQRRALLGIEGNLVNMIAKQLNFSLEIIVPPSEGLADFGTKRGLMDMVVNDQVDFALGGFGLSKNLVKLMTPGVVHYDSAVTFAVPTGRPYTSFEKLFFPFKWRLWIAVSGVLICAIVCIVIVRLQGRPVREFVFGRMNRTPVMVLICVLFGSSLPRCPTRNFARTLLMFWILCTMILRTAFQASLYKILQTPKNVSSPMTIEDMYRDGLYLYMMESSKQYFTISPEMLERVKFLQNDHLLLERFVDQLGERELQDGAVLIAVDKIAYYNKFNSENRFIPIIQETVFRYPVAMFYPKNSVLQWVFNIEVLKLRSTGLIELWASRHGNYDLFDRLKHPEAVKQLSIEHLKGIFEIYGVLVASSIIVFLIYGVLVASSIIVFLIEVCVYRKVYMYIFRHPI